MSVPQISIVSIYPIVNYSWNFVWFLLLFWLLIGFYSVWLLFLLLSFNMTFSGSSYKMTIKNGIRRIQAEYRIACFIMFINFLVTHYHGIYIERSHAWAFLRTQNSVRDSFWLEYRANSFQTSMWQFSKNIKSKISALRASFSQTQLNNFKNLRVLIAHFDAPI